MTTEQWLKMLRRKLADVDKAAERRTDQQLLESCSDAVIELVARQVGGFEVVSVGLNKADQTTYGIRGATAQQMFILVLWVAHEELTATYRERVERGELGISWKSGLEEESSIQAEKSYRLMLDETDRARVELLITYQRQTANGRLA